LKEHALSVRVMSAAALTREDLHDADVLIVDGEVQKPGLFGGGDLRIEGIDLDLDDLQELPVVLMGGVRGAVADGLHLKLSWQYG
jgi:hypothetical protein